MVASVDLFDSEGDMGPGLGGSSPVVAVKIRYGGATLGITFELDGMSVGTTAAGFIDELCIVFTVLFIWSRMQQHVTINLVLPSWLLPVLGQDVLSSLSVVGEDH